MKKNRHHSIRIWVFAIPVFLLLTVLIFSLKTGDSFLATMTSINNGILSWAGWLYSFVTFVTLILVVAVIFSPFGKTIIGGSSARKKLRNIDVFAIILCSIIGIGMVTMGTSEVMAHYINPPSFLGVSGYSTESANFAIRAIYLHWTFPAYALYALPSLLFAFAYYNMNCRYSVSSYFAPVLGKKNCQRFGSVIDIICIFSLLCGMISTIGAAVLTLIGGISYLTDNQISKNFFIIAVIVIALVATFIISSVTGVMRGIKLLSNINLWFFIIIAIVTFIFGPTRFILNYGTEGIGAFLKNFPEDIVRTNAVSGDQWAYWWSIFYWAAYMAWAPISSMFIGKICYGQSVRKIALLTMVFPSIFTGIWMAIFSGASIHYEMAYGGIAEAYLSGYENTAYAVFEHLPGTIIIVIVFLLIAALSVVTAADSTTDVLSGLIVDEKNNEMQETKGTEEKTAVNMGQTKIKTLFKILYGVIIGVCTLIIVAFADFSGVKMICNIGALPAMFIQIMIILGTAKILKNPKKFDECQ